MGVPYRMSPTPQLTHMPKKETPSTAPVMYLDDEDVIGELPEPKLPYPRQFSTIMTNLRKLEGGRSEITIVNLADGIEFSRIDVSFLAHPDMDVQLDCEVIVDDPEQHRTMTSLWIESIR